MDRCWISLANGRTFRVEGTVDAVVALVLEARVNGDTLDIPGTLKLPGVPGVIIAEHVVHVYPLEDA